MEEIIRTLLLEGIDEDTIHKVLDVIEEEYEVVSEFDQNDRYIAAVKATPKREEDLKSAKEKMTKTGKPEDKVVALRALTRLNQVRDLRSTEGIGTGVWAKRISDKHLNK